MKQLLVILFCLGSIIPASAQLTPKSKCGDFTVDILDGIVNGNRPNVNIDELKKNLPCFTSTEEENSSSKCGGGVFYKDRDIYFYTGRDYVQIGEKFKGKMSIPLIGTKRGSLFNKLGQPKIKDTNWDAYQTQYGTLVLYYNAAGKVNKIQFSTKPSDSMSPCE
jgi:hypothetical protein